MFKIWAKTLIGDKITGDYMYINGDKYDREQFNNYLIEICHEMDQPTPVVLKSHLNSFHSFNIVTFKASDFVEYVDFDKLVLENAGDN